MASPWEKYALSPPAAVDVLPSLLTERAAARAVAFTPEEQAANAAQEGKLRESNLAALDIGIRSATDPKIRQILETERALLLKEPPATIERPWDKYQTQKTPAAAPPPKEPLKIGREGFQQALKETLGEAGPWDRFWSAVGTAPVNAALAWNQLTGRQTQGEAAQVPIAREQAEASLPGAIAGNIALIGSAPAGTLQRGLTAGINRVLPQGQGLAARGLRSLAPTVGAAGTGAALATGTTPILEGESRAAVAGMGALGGGSGDVATRLAARAVQPIMQSEAVKTLLGQGIVPTPGQALGPKSIINRVEQQLESVPLLGWFVWQGRTRAVKEMNLAALEKTVPEGQKAAFVKAGRDSITQAHELVDSAYDAAYARITKPVALDPQFAEAIKRIPNAEGIDLPDSQVKQFARVIQDRVLSRMEGDTSPETLRAIHNSLGAVSRKYRSSLDPDQQSLGQAFAQARDEFRGMVGRQSGGAFKETLDALDKKYAALLAIDRAAGYAGSKEGVFSAEALRQAAKKSSREMRDFSQSAADVLGRTVPDSGTAGRVLLPVALGGAAAGNESLGGPTALTAALLAPALYSRIGSRYALGDFPAQARIAAGLRGLTPEAIIAGQTMAKP